MFVACLNKGYNWRDSEKRAHGALVIANKAGIAEPPT